MTDNKKEEIMNDEKWNKRIAPLEEWIEANSNDDNFEMTILLLNMALKRGNKNPTQRQKNWNLMLAEMRDIETSPIGGKGSPSNYPQFVQDSCKIIHDGIIKEQTPAHGHYTSLTTFRRKTEGEGVKKTTIRTFFINGADKATAYADGRITMLKKMYTDGEWDGRIEGLSAIAEIHPQNLGEEE